MRDLWGPYAERLMRRPEPRATRVFVYGTLLKEEPNHRVLRTARFIARARTAPRFTLLNMGPFPGMLDEGNSTIEGEVYDVTEPILRALDRLESHPHFFRRQWITLGDRSHAQAYLLRAERRFAKHAPIGAARNFTRPELFQVVGDELGVQ